MRGDTDTTAGLVVGFDLDMTLIDTRPGFAATLTALSEQTGVAFDIDEMTSRLGPPLSHLLAPYFPDFPAERIDGLVDDFRSYYADHAIAPTQEFDGAHAALDAVHRAGGTNLV